MFKIGEKPPFEANITASPGQFLAVAALSGTACVLKIAEGRSCHEALIEAEKVWKNAPRSSDTAFCVIDDKGILKAMLPSIV